MNDYSDEIERRTVARVREELTPVDLEQAFDEMIDECYSFDGIGGPFEHMSPSRVLAEMDPTARRCGIADMSDNEDYEEIGGDSYDRREVERIREDVTTEYDDELADADDDDEEDE